MLPTTAAQRKVDTSKRCMKTDCDISYILFADISPLMEVAITFLMNIEEKRKELLRECFQRITMTEKVIDTLTFELAALEVTSILNECL